MSITVDADFPGGNVVVEGLEGDLIRVAPDLRDTEGWWFWWNFRVRGAAGRRLRVEFSGEKGPVGPLGPAVKVAARPWRWAGGEFSERHFVFRAPEDADEVRFAFSFPYQLEDLERFIAARRDSPDFSVGELARTREGRSVPLLTLGRAGSPRNVIFTCRHHACESVAGYALEGLTEQLLSPAGEGLRRELTFHLAPMMDLDGVERGDQGKNRRPHDHNRDYTDSPLYPTVRAMESLIARLAGRLELLVDFHCPWIRGGRNEAVFLVEPPASHRPEFERFRRSLKKVDTGPVPYTGRADIAHGVEWNQSLETSACGYARRCGGPALRTAFTLELSYSRTEGAPATPDGARAFGRAFGRALGGCSPGL